MSHIQSLAMAFCITVIGVGVYGYIEAKNAWKQDFELITDNALSHAYSRSTLKSWMKKLNISTSADNILYAKSAHGVLQAGEEFIVVYRRGTIDLTRLHILETEKAYRVETRIPDIDLIGTRYAMTEKVGDSAFTEIVRTSKYDVIYIYGGDG